VRLYLSTTQKLLLATCLLALLVMLPTVAPAWLGDEPRFPFVDKLPAVSVAPNRLQQRLEREGPRRLDLNTATTTQLQQLPGVGPVLAGRIADFRRAHGPFRSVNDLDQVKGIGPAKIKLLRLQVSALPPGSERR
jgi:competence ComEA-like helix-hairpin-helix protein